MRAVSTEKTVIVYKKGAAFPITTFPRTKDFQKRVQKLGWAGLFKPGTDFSDFHDGAENERIWNEEVRNGPVYSHTESHAEGCHF